MIKAIVVDDEIPSINILNKLLEMRENIEIIASFDKATQALEYLKNNSVDILFLDIEMPVINGLEFAEIISNDDKIQVPKIIYITAYNQYAVEAFRVNALDYLLKPISKARFDITIDRIMDELDVKTESNRMSVKTFGKFEVYANKKRVKFRTKKAEELIALFIDNRGKNVARSWIIDSLWEDFDGDKAMINFNTTLYNVRKALSNAGLNIQIVFESESYSIQIDDIDCDYFKFYSYKLKEALNDDSYKEAMEILSLYTDDYLKTNNYNWSDPNMLSLKEKYLRLAVLIVDYLLSKNQVKNAIDVLKESFNKGCIDDIIVYTLIELLINEKKFTMALKYYKLHKENLQLVEREPNRIFKKLLSSI